MTKPESALGRGGRADRRRALLAALGVALAPLPVRAQERFPARALRLIVPFSPAGATDLLARLTGEGLSRRLGTPVVVDNRPGAGGNLGAKLVLDAPADGHTLLMGPTSIYAAGTTMSPNRGFDLLRDFAPVCTVGYVPHVLVVPAGLGVANLAGLLQAAKAKPGQFSMASQGVGTISHLEGELFQTLAGVDFVHVPYKGSAPAHLDLLGGRVQVMFDSVAAALPHIRAGKLLALGVTTPARTAVLPGVPTLAEAGVTGFVAESWVGVLVPSRSPGVAVERLSREVQAVVGDSAFAGKLAAHGVEAKALAGAQYVQLIQRETTHWAAVVKRAGITLE